MAYDEQLVDSIRALLADRRDVTERRMFGGFVFLVGGHMAVAASGKGGLMVRCDPDQTDTLLTHGVEPMVMRDKPMRGWLRVSDDAIASDEALATWVAVGSAYAGELPPK